MEGYIPIYIIVFLVTDQSFLFLLAFYQTNEQHQFAQSPKDSRYIATSNDLVMVAYI